MARIPPERTQWLGHLAFLCLPQVQSPASQVFRALRTDPFVLLVCLPQRQNTSLVGWHNPSAAPACSWQVPYSALVPSPAPCDAAYLQQVESTPQPSLQYCFKSSQDPCIFPLHTRIGNQGLLLGLVLAIHPPWRSPRECGARMKPRLPAWKVLQTTEFSDLGQQPPFCFWVTLRSGQVFWLCVQGSFLVMLRP